MLFPVANVVFSTLLKVIGEVIRDFLFLYCHGLLLSSFSRVGVDHIS